MKMNCSLSLCPLFFFIFSFFFFFFFFYDIFFLIFTWTPNLCLPTWNTCRSPMQYSRRTHSRGWSPTHQRGNLRQQLGSGRGAARVCLRLGWRLQLAAPRSKPSTNPLTLSLILMRMNYHRPRLGIRLYGLARPRLRILPHFQFYFCFVWLVGKKNNNILI